MTEWLVSVELHTLPSGVLGAPRAGEVIAGPSEILLRCARARGLKTAVLATRPDDYPAGSGAAVDAWIRVDTGDPGAMAAGVASLGGQVRAVTCGVDNRVGTAAVLARQIGVRGPAPEGAALQRDKSEVRRALAAHGVESVRWGVVPAADPRLSSPIGYPAVAKPVDGAASWDVALVNNDAEARRLARAHLGRTYGRGVEPRRRLLFEEVLDGSVHSAEGVVDDAGMPHVFGYSSRVLTPPPHFAELALTFAGDPPAPGSPRYVAEVLAAVGHDFGAFHLEFVLTQRGPRIIEHNARLVGAGLQYAIGRLIGTPPADLLLDALLGEQVQVAAYAGATTELRLTAPGPGILTGVSGLEQAVASDGCYAAGLYVGLGSALDGAVENNSARIGFVQTSGPDRVEALRRARSAAGRIALTLSRVPAR